MPTPQTVNAAVRAIARNLLTHTSTAQLDAELLVAHVMGHDRTWLVGHRDDALTPTQVSHLTDLVAQRQRGIPLAYITGSKEFYGRSFIVTPDVLIPRPDSESIVEAAITAISPIPKPRVLEVGTGSGCIAITIALECPNATVRATDISPAALQITQKNATQLGANDCITFAQQDLLTNESGQYDLLVANLPYVPTHWLTDDNKKQYSLVTEPELALHGGDDGMDIIKRFLEQFAAHPVSDQLILEHGDGQSVRVKKLLEQHLPDATHTVIYDLSGKERGWQIYL